MNPSSPNHPFPPFPIKKHHISTTPTATSGPLKSDEVGYDEFLLGDSCPPMSQFEESQLTDESPYLYGSDFTDDESEKVGPNRLACEVSSGVSAEEGGLVHEPAHPTADGVDGRHPVGGGDGGVVVGGSVANGPGGTPTTPDHSDFLADMLCLHFPIFKRYSREELKGMMKKD